MMELDEAIKHAEEKAEELESTCALWKRLADERDLSIPSDYEPCKKCAEEHRQLAEWLKELKALREQKRPHGEKKCPVCGSDLYEHCGMCCYEGEKVRKNGN